LNLALSRADFQKALRLSESLLELNPADVQVWIARGVAQAQLNQPSESLFSFRRALEISPNSLSALKGAAQVAYSQHDPHASEWLQRIIVQDPKNVTAHAMLGSLAIESRDCQTAVGEFAQAGPAIQQNAAALFQYGDCLLTLNRPKEAVQAFGKLLALAPDNPAAKYKAALSLSRAGEMAAAIELLKSLPPNSKALNLLGECYLIEKDTDSARTALQKALQLSPIDEQSYVDLGILYIEQKQPRLAIEVANSGLRLLPNSPRLHTVRGAAYTWLNEVQRAAEDFEQADRLEPEQLYGSVGMSMLLRQDDHSAEAIQILRSKIDERPQDATLHFLLADTFIRAGAEPGQAQFDEAVRLLEKTVDLSPAFEKARVLLGKQYVRASRPQDAVQQFREAVRLDPHDRSALNQLFLLLHRTGKTAEAEATEEKLKKLIAEDAKSNLLRH
jgi:Flp pilus assembly protein TadD